MNVIETQHLTKIFKDGASEIHALNDVNLTIEKSTFNAVVGTSGSGKTTLINMLGGLDTPTSGTVTIDGTVITGMKDRELSIFRRKKLGIIFQNYNLVPTLNIYENIVFPVDLDGRRVDKAFVEEVIHTLHLKERLGDYPYQLSGGQQQRVAIARALAAKPSVILADEPTGSLDSKNSQNIAGLLKECVDTFKQTLVMITHNLELAQLADRVVRMEDGRIQE
ncbi:ABC transporter ATP-binding protein [Faecalicatena sp. AGMB00832]|uniref:ABC transporter ATP-binding protein n=1 Tax=Faecalicatena faecalis TaxID=2726362 RepID=A0ABS6D7J5_9FIRM|nr:MULTISPECIES: ABC transporter ATP-binding protein [Faecalicatena]MBU3877240.1 ABC transporter ATP-binding protein [Faecalicatena faecalis]MCI6467309.1 ABC transporter ATP-binding protein [Faecalicatena sp.]MDY5620314.1 ABC transporter ATP-binding protein [Lachnospiraceae bacterium]